MATIAFKPAAPTPELASARLRAYLPCQYLAAAGWDCTIFDPADVNDYEVVIFQKAYTADDLDLVARLRRRGAATVFDLCDNHFYDPECRPVFQERAERLRRMIDAVDAVTVSTTQLGAQVGRTTSVIDDALDPIRPDPLAGVRRWWRNMHNRPLRVVWFGGAGQDYPPFGLVDLERIIPDLGKAHAQCPLRLTVISNSRERFAPISAACNFPMEYREYQTATFQHVFRQHDVCVVPVNVNPFTICKTVNRPALSLQLGMPVIVDPLPSYEEIRPFVAVGNWIANITAIAADRIGWQHKTQTGADYLARTYTAQRVVAQWCAILEKLRGCKSRTQAA